MPWGRMDDSFADHPKVEPLSLAAVGLWAKCWSIALRHVKTAPRKGFVSDSQVRRYAGTRAKPLIRELTTPIEGKSTGMWEPVDGGYLIHDFVDYLPKQRDPAEAAEAGRRGAAKRWQTDSNSHSSSDGNSQGEPIATSHQKNGSRASRSASPTRPDPNPTYEDQDSGGNRPETLPPATATEPPPDEDQPTNPTDARCTAHRGVIDPGPCRGCMQARERAEKRVARDEVRAAGAAETARAACPDCHGSGWRENPDGTPAGKCDHRNASPAARWSA